MSDDIDGMFIKNLGFMYTPPFKNIQVFKPFHILLLYESQTYYVGYNMKDQQKF